MADAVVLEAVHSRIDVFRQGRNVIVLAIHGRDIGEHGDQPQRALDAMLQQMGEAELFIDARDALGPSLDVGARWAYWLGSRRDRLKRVNMLTRSRFVTLTADFVQRYAGLTDIMRIYTDSAAFDTALELALD
jgi:hypothetical protein